MGKFAPIPGTGPNPEGWIVRRFRDIDRQLREIRAEKRTRFADIGDDFTMTPEGPKPTSAMPTPEGLTVTAGIERIKVVWSGSASTIIPAEFGRLAIHASKISGYTPTQGTEVATISSPYGGSALYAADGGSTYYVRCAIASLRGDYGDFTEEVAVTPGVAADSETFTGDVVGRSIAIATTVSGSYPETFSGTAWPTGWAHVRKTSSIPGVNDPAVVSSGVPTGSDNGSAVLVDFGASGVDDGALASSSGIITTSHPESVDSEVLIRFQHSATPSTGGIASTPAESLIVWVRADLAGSAIDRGIGFQLARRFPTVSETTTSGTTVLGSAAAPTGGLIAGQWYMARLRVVAGRIEASVWADGAAEPDPAIYTANDVLDPGGFHITWEVGDFLTDPTVGLDTYIDSMDVEAYSTGFTVLPDGVARMTRADIDSMPTKLQASSETVTVAAASTRYTQAVTFGEPFLEVPEVVVTPYVSFAETADASATGITTTGFTLNYYRTIASDMTVGWVAVAP